jgi:anti-anti-sigma regulatory factor
MLRISVDQGPDNETRVRVEGSLVGPWVDELRASCEPIRAAGRALRLDLTGVQFADRAGARLLADLLEKNVEFEGVSPFVRALLGIPGL